MKLLFPKNIFTSILLKAVPEEIRKGVSFKEASLIGPEIAMGNAEVALMPSYDLMKHPELYVSSKIALSFDGDVSNSYLYFPPNQNKFTDLYLNGDVTLNEIILSKLLFSEKYGTEIQIHLDTINVEKIDKNYLIVGDSNLTGSKYLQGMSFSDEISEMLFLPYVNFVAVSPDKESLAKFNTALKDMDAVVETHLDKYLRELPFDEGSKDYLKSNLNSVYFEMTGSEEDGLKELLQMPYYHGIWDDLVELKFV